MPGWKVTQPIEWKDIMAATKTTNIHSFWAVKDDFTKVHLHDNNTWVPQVANVDSEVLQDIVAIFQHLEGCHPATKQEKKQLTPQKISEGSYLWKVLQKQAWHLWKRREQAAPLNSANLIPEMTKLVNEHRRGEPLCSGARAGVLTATGLVPRTTTPAPPPSSSMPLPPPFSAGPSLPAGTLSDEDEFLQIVEHMNAKVPSAQLNPAVIPRVGSSVNRDPPKNFQTPSMETLDNQINEYLSTRSRKPGNPIEGLRQKEVFVEIPVMPKTSAKRKGEKLSGEGEAMAGSHSKRLRGDTNTPTEMDDSQVEEEVGLPTLGAMPDTATVDPQFISEHCTTVWAACMVTAGAVFLGEPARSLVRDTVTQATWNATETILQNEESEDPLVRSYCKTVADMDSYTFDL
ncbi:hypothetical protein FRC00_003675 [Tulasnella sp. 408]|nr:hypothetical protein FRC00_003675 [Tulasnella sp. 408]